MTTCINPSHRQPVRALPFIFRPLFFAFCCTLLTPSLHAQLEGAHLFSKGFNANGLGGFLHAGFPVSQGDEISGEAGFYYLAGHGSHIATVPFLAGYRHTLDHSGSRWYVEPFAGYTFGGTDIQKTDANGNLLYDSDGKEIDQKISGPTAGGGFGYILPSARLPLNFGLRYQHIFVSGDPAQNILSLRVSWSVRIGRSGLYQ